MLAIGGLLVSIAVLTLAAVAPVFRRNDPPRWTTRGWIGELITLAIVCTLALGLGYLGAGAIATAQGGPDYIDLALLAVILCISVLIFRRLRAGAGPATASADGSGHPFAAGPGRAHSETRAQPTMPATASAPPPHKAA